jgi:heat shock protein HslJ
MNAATKAFGLAVLVCAGLAACNADKKSVQSASPAAVAVNLPGTQWTLEEIGGKPVIANSQATLTFPEAGRAAGNGSCNQFTGSAQVNGNTIKFGPMAATRMMCDPEASGQETEYFKALQGAQRFELRDGKLLIYAVEMEKPLRFARANSAQDK